GGPETETPLGVVELQRGEAEVENDPVDRTSDPLGYGSELSEVGVLQHHGDVGRHRFPGEPLEGGGVAIEAEQHAARPQALDQRPRIATTTERGVDERLPRGWLKARYDVL